MKYRKLGNTDLNASVVAFGTWGIGGGSVWQDTSLDESDIGYLLDEAHDCGINYIDTAPVYGMGDSETLLGKALKTRRDKFLLQTKCSLNWREGDGNFHYSRDGYTVNNNTGAKAVRQDVEDSLKRMGTDYIDIIVVHYVCGDWPVEETVGALQDLIREGKIRAIGISNSTPDDLKAYVGAGQSDVCLAQEQFSLLAPSHGQDFFPVCKETGATFQVYGALEEGFLTGPERLDSSFGGDDIRTRLPWSKEPYNSGIRSLYEKVWGPMREKYGCSYANLIEAWTLAQYENISLLTGFRKKKTIEDTVKCFDIRLEEEDIRMLSETAQPVQVKELDK